MPGVVVEFRSRTSQRKFSAIASSEGIYRLNSLPVGDYDVTVAGTGFAPSSANLRLSPHNCRFWICSCNQRPAPAMTKGPSGLPGPEGTAAPAPEEETGLYPGLRRPEPEVTLVPIEVEVLPAETDNFAVEPDRWEVEMPKWQRYGKKGEFPYSKSHWYDPFNRNRLKGDYPIFGQRWFFNFTGTSLTGFDARRLPTPSNVASERPGSREFFGRGQQSFVIRRFGSRSISFAATLRFVRLISGCISLLRSTSTSCKRKSEASSTPMCEQARIVLTLTWACRKPLSRPRFMT